MLGMVSMPNGTVGVEGAGVVTRVGDSECTFVAGEHAFGWIGKNFCSYSMSLLSAMLHSPAHLTHEEIATMSTAWTTVDHAFGPLCANISFDTTILIHTATGSVGIAALWLAQSVDACVVATAGQDRKRVWLTGQAAPMISTSRDPEQFNTDLELWFGKLSQPLTTVLNALSGEFIRISLCHLASGGAFAELGKREIWSAEQTAAHRVDASFVPMDETVMEPHITSIHTSVETRAQTGLYGPLPIQSFSAEQCSEAFKYLRTAGHIGKVSTKSGQCDG